MIRKTDEAKKNIELALGTLDAILAMKESPKLLPIQNRMVVKNFIGGTDEVGAVLKSVETA